MSHHSILQETRVETKHGEHALNTDDMFSSVKSGNWDLFCSVVEECPESVHIRDPIDWT